MITLEAIDKTVQSGPYADDWVSLSTHPFPGWFRDAKFGIFIHWGVYSVPAFNNEWYPRSMYTPGTAEFEHHVKTYGPQSSFGYKDFIPMFRAERFDPDAWAELFEEAGAKYVIPVAEHHDGFQMYRSELSHWNAFEMGPKRDIAGELYRSFEKRGLIPGGSSHRAEHWFFLGQGKTFDSDIREPIRRGDLYWPSMPETDISGSGPQPAPSREYLEDWLLRTCEYIDTYHPRILYFDWWIRQAAFRPYLKKLAAFYYNSAARRGEEVIIASKQDGMPFGTGLVDMERGKFAAAQPYPWQTDTAVALNSWCYTEQNVYRTAPDLVRDLVDIVSKNGNLLLNIGPKADGTIPDADAGILRDIGAWLKANGESVYGTRPWKRSADGPTEIIEGQFTDASQKPFTSEDVRYTAKGAGLYATALKPSADGSYLFPALGIKGEHSPSCFEGFICGVTRLDDGSPAEWTRDEAGLHVQTAPGGNDMPVAFRISVE